MSMKVAVLGGGNTGCVMAAEFSLRGLEVALFEEKEFWNEHINGILSSDSCIEVKGQDLTGLARIHLITDDLALAVREAEVIFVSMVAWRHQMICDRLAALIHEGQTVIFSAGNFASICLRRALGLDHPAVVGEMMGNIFPCRMVGDGEAVIGGKLVNKKVAAFPASDTDKLVEAVSHVFPCVPGVNVFDTALNAPNVVVHLAGSLLNIANVERNPDFGLYRDGLSPAVVRVIKAVEAEKKQVTDVMGYSFAVHSDHMEKVMTYDQYPELEVFRSLKGPDCAMHRYINEDAACGDCLILSLAGKLGIEMPVLQSRVRVASVINGKDYMTEGITMEKLGIPGTTPEEINQYLLTAEQ